MALDKLHFPTLAAYLSSLPEGLASHPSAQIKGAVLRDVYIPAPLRVVEGLPDEVRELILHPPPHSVWVPEVHFHALLHAAYDHFFIHRMDEYDQWISSSVRSLLNSPLYRIAFFVISPARLRRSMQSRWELVRRGTELQLEELADASWMLRIKHPFALYSDLHRRTRAVTLRTTLECAGAKGVTIEFGQVTLLSWQVFVRWQS